MTTKEIDIAAYDYPLPDERIAKYPVAVRDQSKLLLYTGGTVSEDTFRNIADHIPAGELMVFNNTRVIQARIHFHKSTGALIEVFLLEPYAPADYEQAFQVRGCGEWLCMVGNLKKWKEGKLARQIAVRGRQVELTAERIAARGASHQVRFAWGDDSVSFADILDAVGELPIPPYLGRPTEASDLSTYQTVYSKIKGSVAAPTAGLHFTERVLADIDAKGIERNEITLHVGAGTFRPVKAAHIGDHPMHTEWISVSRQSIDALLRHGAQATAVGTTSVRTLESLYYMGVKCSDEADGCLAVEQWEPYETCPTLSAREALQRLADYMDRNGLDVLHASTRIIIAPGYRYHIVRRLVTNFHQPKSTLLLLVSAFVGGHWRAIYDYALAHGFRFLSYGDSSLLEINN